MGRAVQGSGHSGCASHCQYCRGDQSPYRADAAPPASAAKAAGFGASNRATARVGATNTVLSIAPPHAFAFRLVLRRDTARPVAPLAHARHGIAGYFVPVFFLNMVDLGPGLLFARSRGRICALRRQPRRPRWISSRSMGRNLCRWAAQRTREAIPGLVPAPQAIAKRPDRGEGYTGTLAHIVAMSQVLHEELKSHGLRVQALCPGVVATEFHERKDWTSARCPACRRTMSRPRGLAMGEVVCAPGVDRADLLDAVFKADLAAFGAQSPQLARRYA